MREMDILQYFNENASKEEWEVVQKVYGYALISDLKELDMEGKESFNLAELALIYTRANLVANLEHVVTVDQEIGCGSIESTKEMFMEIMTETLEEYEAKNDKEEEK